MLSKVNIGASVTMTPQEADSLCGVEIRMVTCPNGRIIGGVGNVGLVEHVGITDLTLFVGEIKSKREELRNLAGGLDRPLYTFVRI